ncbi:hypothetical protein OHA99_07635 [Streptomyces coelicoflavus]|uniref:hypothetical protein n=1 Tax=Streptomyces TaxID=1883 RepID=UPI00129160B3|nr:MULTISPECIES: hypothetical protein [Streptomyces]MCX5034686.1 hypothetical protein [Streptomyces coelicoflavus]MCX5039882.1 hypothetical protein [Streptomyces coelicoflavus]MCX5039901.1 hypothetical protein [Streptomyces coelicoflavus]MCX5041455.1 hypothetical protein [Streptomyces coelicoflavus]QFX81063.1 hypothetical protein GEV49_09135 [Streptomyces sp. SYP-A7193]
MRRAAHGRAHARLRGALALLVGVVALLCVFGHAERDGQGTPPPTAERVQTLVVAATNATHAANAVAAQPSDGAAAPCGKKAVADHSVQRAENPPPPSTSGGRSGLASPHTDPAPLLSQHVGPSAGGPDPPPATLHSVLRI